MRGWTRLNADQAWRQHRKKLQYLGAGHTLADNNRAITRYAVNLEYRLRNIETDRANLAHGRLPSLWFALSATTLGTIDATEWAPSTASKPEILRLRLCCPLYPRKRTSGSSPSMSAKCQEETSNPLPRRLAVRIF